MRINSHAQNDQVKQAFQIFAQQRVLRPNHEFVFTRRRNFSPSAPHKLHVMVQRLGVKLLIALAVSPYVHIEYPRFSLWKRLLQQQRLLDGGHAANLAAMFLALAVGGYHSAPNAENESHFFRWLPIRRLMQA